MAGTAHRKFFLGQKFMARRLTCGLRGNTKTRAFNTAFNASMRSCVFGELVQGKPLFMGNCEIGQLVEIFQVAWRIGIIVAY